jgi:hypothetical protein
MADDPSKFVEVNGAFVKRLDEHMVLEDERAGKTSKNEIRRQGWHVGKEIPLAVVGVFIVQTASIIWFTATMVAKVDFMKDTEAVEKAAMVIDQKRQDDDARRSEDRIILRLDKFDAKLDRMIEKK